MSTLSPDLTIIDGIPRVSSLDIAEHFQKPHADVLKTIRRISSECPAEFIEGNFSLNEYTDGVGRALPMYQLSRDGFTLLAMGFAGKKALAWKLVYIKAFNTMEKALLNQCQPKALPAPLPVTNENQRRLHEDLEMLIRITRNLTDSMQVYGGCGARYSQLEIARRINNSADAALYSLFNAQEHLHEANRFMQMLH